MPGKIWAAERITAFDLEFRINQDSSVDVTEKIEYDFGDTGKEQLFFRDISTEYEMQGKKYSLHFSRYFVFDENGKPRNFSGVFSRGKMFFTIGDQQKFLTGKETFVIKYRVKGLIDFSENRDEFHWRAIGNQWGIPMENVTARVIFPDET